LGVSLVVVVVVVVAVVAVACRVAGAVVLDRRLAVANSGPFRAFPAPSVRSPNNPHPRVSESHTAQPPTAKAGWLVRTWPLAIPRPCPKGLAYEHPHEYAVRPPTARKKNMPFTRKKGRRAASVNRPSSFRCLRRRPRCQLPRPGPEAYTRT